MLHLHAKAEERREQTCHACAQWCAVHAEAQDEDEMGKTGRTRARSRSGQHEGQRQPNFTILTTEDTPEAQRTCTPAARDATQPEDAPPERHMRMNTPAEEERYSRGEREQTLESAGRWNIGQEGEAKGVEVERAEVHSGDQERETERESERGSLSEENADNGRRVGEEKEKHSYWKEVEQRVEIGVSESLENAHVARHAAYEALGETIDPTSSEGEEEGQAVEQRRARRKAREVGMEERRAQRANS
eukprot:1741309-Pleurochrysis_carterae.AAC.2